MEKKKPKNVKEYIEQLPQIAQAKIKELRAILKSLEPEAKEGLKWEKPVFESKKLYFLHTLLINHI
jgi:uncharacterized protein YdhG (YjbR/CyaY superfamily)